MLYFIGMDIKFHKTNTIPETLNEGEVYFVKDEHAIYVGESDGETQYGGVKITYSDIRDFNSSVYGFDMFPFYVSNNDDTNNNNRIATLFKIQIPEQQGVSTVTYNTSNSTVLQFLGKKGAAAAITDSWFYIMDPKKNFSLGSNIQTYIIPASVYGNGTFISIQWIGLSAGNNTTPYVGTYTIQASTASDGNVSITYKEDLLSSGSTSGLETVVLDASTGTISNNVITKLKNSTCRLQVTNAIEKWGQKNDAVCVFTDELDQLKISLISGDNGFTFGYYQVNIGTSSSSYSLGELHTIDIVNNGDGTKYLSDNGTYKDKFSDGGTKTLTSITTTPINTSGLNLSADYIEIEYTGSNNVSVDFHRPFANLFPNRSKYPQYLMLLNNSNYIIDLAGPPNGTFAYTFDRVIIQSGQWAMFRVHGVHVSVDASNNNTNNQGSSIVVSPNNGMYINDSLLQSGTLDSDVITILTRAKHPIPLYTKSIESNNNRLFNCGYNYNGTALYISQVSPQTDSVRLSCARYNTSNGSIISSKYLDIQMAGDGDAFLTNDGTYKKLITTGSTKSVSSLANLTTSTAEKEYDLLTVNISTPRSLINDFKTTMNGKFFTQTNKVQYLQVKYNGTGTYRITTTGTVSGNSWRLGFSEIILNGAGTIEFSGLNNFITANVSNNGTIY